MFGCCGFGFALSLLSGASAAAPGLHVEHPVPYVLCQRRKDGQGVIRVRGRIVGVANPGKIEARFNDGPWQVLDPAPKDGRFAGTLVGRTGQGRLDVRCSTDHARAASVEPVAVGDLFLVTGQSNADGRGNVHIKMAKTNPFVGVKFCGGVWSGGDDPSDNSRKYGSPWPMVLNTLIPEQRVPMGFIQAAVGSTVVRQWRKGGSMFTRMTAMVRKATDGGMGVKAVLYYQGENDLTHWNKLTVFGDYKKYKMHLTAMVKDFHDLLTAPVLVGQITNMGSKRDWNDSIRRAQQEIWADSPHARPGSVTHDIYPTDGCHYRTEPNMRAFAGRWSFAIRSALYKPQPRPNLVEVKRLPGNRIQLTYNRPLCVSNWQGNKAKRPRGFRIEMGAGTLSDKDITRAQVDGKTVLLSFAKPIPADAKLCYGSGADGQGKPVLRDAKTGQPVPMLFGVPLR